MVASNTLNSKLRKAKKEGWFDWIRNEHDERAVMNGCYFDIDAAQHVRDFFSEFLRHSKDRRWAGNPFILLDWQWEWVIAPAFGWMRPDGYRRIRKIYCEINKKNGKSTLAAGVGLYLLLADGEPGARVFSTATKKEQAALVHDEAVNMVKASPELRSRLRLNRTTKTISHEKADGKYAALAVDGAGIEGENISGLIVDEMHVWTDRSFWEGLFYGDIARTQPLTFIVTTAGVWDPTSLGWQEHDYAMQWLEDRIEDQEYWAYNPCATKEDIEGDGILDPAVHRKANPSYDVTIDPDEIMKAAKRAKAQPSLLNNFIRRRLGFWVQAFSSWLDMAKWGVCSKPVDEELMRGRPCFAGLDLASKIDLTAWVLVFPPTDDDPLWRILPRFWVPAEMATTRSQNDKVKYLEWGRDGFLTLTPGNETDYSAVRAQIAADRAKFEFAEGSIGADPWNLTDIRQQVDPEALYIIELRQVHENLSEPTKKIEALVLSEAIAHGGHPVLRWCMGNVKLLEDTNGNMRPSKKHSTEKIDGAVAFVMAMNRALAVTDDECEYNTKPEFFMV